MTDLNQLSSYDYTLPEKLIARYPLARREQSRLMKLDKNSGEVEHSRFSSLPELLNEGDCLVLNQTKVLAARILGRRVETGGKWEGLFIKALSENEWEIIGKTRGKLQPGEIIAIDPVDSTETNTLQLELIKKSEEGGWIVKPSSSIDDLSDPAALLEHFGTMPLPPYIGRTIADKSDWDRYQTTYAKEAGAVAAPTAGLHFTPEILKQCEDRGVTILYVTLHVGIGTFRPINVESLSDHTMHKEWCEVTEEVAAAIQQTKQNGKRVIAIGTTSVRTLESASQTGTISAFQGTTDLFIQPGYEFKVVDGLLTNFHLPCSSLLVMISALAGFEPVRNAYQEAIKEKYRFYSYGDAMFIS